MNVDTLVKFDGKYPIEWPSLGAAGNFLYETAKTLMETDLDVIGAGKYAKFKLDDKPGQTLEYSQADHSDQKVALGGKVAGAGFERQ